jgi:hypothetical protein
VGIIFKKAVSTLLFKGKNQLQDRGWWSEVGGIKIRSDAASGRKWALWREEVMPGRSSGEAMLALTHQEAKTKKRASKLK